MDEKTKKIIPVLLAIVLFAILIFTITTSEIPISQLLKYGSLFLALFFVPFLLIFGIHYWVLGRILHNPHPFENFKLGYFGPQLQNPRSGELHAIRFYTLSSFISTFVSIPVSYLLRKIDATKFLWDVAIHSIFIEILIQWLLIAPGISIILLIFSKKTLGKPLSETWKAILAAGFASGTFVGLYALFFYHFVLPHLRI